MYLNAGNTKIFKKFTAIALSLLLGQPTYSQSSENQHMVFEGTLTDVSGNPISLSGVTLNFYISANGCYLYGESSATAGDSQGQISHRFGNGTLLMGSPNAFSQNLFFGNVAGTTTFAGNNCSVTAADTRLAQVYYPAQNITATIKLSTVPYAQNATMLGGKSATDFIQVSADTNTLLYAGMTGQYLTKGVSGLTWTNNTLTASQVSAALGYTPASATTALTSAAISTALGYTPASATALANYAVKSSNLSDLTSATLARGNLGLGTLATKNSVNLSSAEVTGTLATTNLPAFSGDVITPAGSATTTVQRLRGIALSTTVPTSGQVMLYNGTAWAPTSIPGNVGTVTNINTGTGLTGGPITSTGTIAVNFGTTSGTVAAGNDSRLLGALQAGNNLSELTSPSVARSNLGLGSFATASSVDLGSASATGIIADARLANQANITSGTQFTKVTVDGKGRVVSGGQLAASDINTALGFTPASVAALANYAVKNNNLSDLTSATAARNNLNLGALATKSILNLATDVSGVLPITNGGSKWTANLGTIYTVSSTTIGSSTAFTNVGLYAVAPVGVSSTIATSIYNPNADGFGLKINVDNTSASHYGLRVMTNNANTNFVVLNNGNVGVGISAATARLHIAAGSSTLAPLRIASGPLVASPTAGAIEFDGQQLYLTDQGNTRRIIASQPSLGVIDNTSTISNSSGITLNPGGGGVIVSSTATSTGFNNGALVVKGGIGVNGNGNFSGQLNATGNINTSGTISSAGNINASGSIVTTMNVIAGSVIAPYMYGGTASGVTLTIDSTNHTNKGNIAIAASGGNVGIGTSSPIYKFQVRSPGVNTYNQVNSASFGSAMIGTGEDSNNQLYNIGFDASGTARWFFTTGGPNYINNNLSLGSTSEIAGNRLSVHGNTFITGNATVSNTLFLAAASTAIVPLQFTSSLMASTPVAGGVEYDGFSLFYTNSAAQRRRLAGGVTSGTIDNVNKITYAGNLLLEGNTTGTTPAITIQNLGTGNVGLQINDNTVVSGSIKLSQDGLDSTVACTAADEGKQRYNKTYKTMEYCDGAYWQGMSGITHCHSTGVSYTLIGTPGTGSAFCISKSNETATTYAAAVTTCQSRTTTRNNSRPYLCSEKNFQMACRQYSIFNTQAETMLPGFRSIYYWIPSSFNTGNIFALQYSTSTTGACNIGDMTITDFGDQSNLNYRCCYD